VLDRLDTEGMLRFAGELVRIPSVGGAETPAQTLVAQWMETAGLDVDIWELDFQRLSEHPAYGVEVERSSGLGVVGVAGGTGDGRDLILNGHVDVVPAGSEDAWSFSPWAGKVEKGRLLGRGSLDMKGALAAGLFAVKAILDAGVRLNGRVIFQSVIGEEDGGVGTLAAIQRGYRADGAIVMEPTGLAICPAQAGALNFRVILRGRSAHGCVRNEGVSALEKFQIVFAELMALEARRNHFPIDPLFEGFRLPFPLSVGKIEGGDWASSVPDWVRIEGRYGLAPGEDPESAKDAFQEALSRAAGSDPWLGAHPPELEWWGGSFLPARVHVEEPIVQELQKAAVDVLGRKASVEGVTYGSDMRLLVREAGTPTVLFGPGDIREAHAVDESVAVIDLEDTSKTLALTALRFCGFEHEPTF